MARSPKEAIIIVLDVGRETFHQSHQNGKTFFELSKTCVMRIIERKIFSLAKDEIGLVIIGSEETDNALDYRHISEIYPLSNPSWTMLKKLDDIVGTKKTGDWLDGIVVAMNILKIETEGKKLTGKKIVLFTNCAVPVNKSRIDRIIKAFQDEEIELTAIGPDIISQKIVKEEELMDVDQGIQSNGMGSQNNMDKEKAHNQKLGEILLANIVKESGGIICSFDDALPQLMFYQKKSVRPTPWNVCLDIGPDIKIPVSGFKKIAEVTLPSWKTVCIDDQTIPVDKERSYFKKDKTAVEKEAIIEGHCFGSTLVPYDESNKTAMNYVSGNKCLSVLGFTKSSNIPRHLLVGNGIYYFVPQRDKPEAVPAFSAFVHNLKDTDMVAVVRRIYNNNNAPYIGALFPKVKETKAYLVYIELPYSEDMRDFVFPSLTSETNKLTKEQLNSVDFLIDNMNLITVDEDGEIEEMLNLKSTQSPYHQHLYRCMAHRVLHLQEELPEVAEDIKQMLKCPFESNIGYKEAVEIIKKHFVLTELKPKNPYRKRNKKEEGTGDNPIASTSKADDTNLTDLNIDDLTKPTVIEVGTIKPEQDFQLLLEKGEPLKEVCSQMQKVILSLVLGSFGTDNFPKALSALKTLRGTCVELHPNHFNSWLPGFKTSILDRAKDAFWQLVKENKQGLITSEENSESSIFVQEAEKFLLIEEEAAPAVSLSEDIDADDLLNEL